jgi:hypothetical protein
MEHLPQAGEKVSRATFAAILTAASSTCTCDVCKILKGIVEDLKLEFTK